MRIICRKRIVCGYPYWHITLPCCCRIPFPSVSSCIFEVSVLHKFRIQPSVGSIADVFKEYTDKFVTDSFLLTIDDFNGCLYITFSHQVRESLPVIVKGLVPEERLVSQRFKVFLYTLNSLFAPFKWDDITGLSLTVYGYHVTFAISFGVFLSSSFSVRREMPELRICRCLPVFSTICLIDHGIGIVSIPDYYRSDNPLMAHLWIVLWSPCGEVVTIGYSKARSIVIDLEHCSISTFIQGDSIFRKHPLLLTPLSVVGRKDLCNVNKLATIRFALVKPSDSDTLLYSWRIEEDLVAGIRCDWQCDKSSNCNLVSNVHNSL